MVIIEEGEVPQVNSKGPEGQLNLVRRGSTGHTEALQPYPSL